MTNKLKALIPYDWFEADAEISAAMDTINANHKLVRLAVDALAARFGARSAVMRGVSVAGFTFEAEPPIGWRVAGQVQSNRFYLPMKTTKDRKAIRAEIDAIRDVDMSSFSGEFGGLAFIGLDDIASKGFSYRRGPICQKIGDALLFGVPHGYPQGQCTKDVSKLVAVPFSRVAAMIEAGDHTTKASQLAGEVL